MGELEAALGRRVYMSLSMQDRSRFYRPVMTVYPMLRAMGSMTGDAKTAEER